MADIFRENIHSIEKNITFDNEATFIMVCVCVFLYKRECVCIRECVRMYLCVCV